MLTTKTQPGTKIRCIDTGGWYCLTKGKIYEVLPDDGYSDASGGFAILDDEGDYCWHSFGFDPEQFELVEQEKDMTDEKQTKEQIPDEFKVGDVVYDLLYGKGRVKTIDANPYPVVVKFEVGPSDTFTQQGKRFTEQLCNRTLFFSEPKIEASVKRPFTPTLVGKTVVVLEYACYPQMFTVEWEDATTFGNSQYKCIKQNCKVHEVLPENLLTSSKT